MVLSKKDALVHKAIVWYCVASIIKQKSYGRIFMRSYDQHPRANAAIHMALGHDYCVILSFCWY